MQNNFTKKRFVMNRFFIVSFLIMASFLFVENVGAISGACSSHNGVNCSMGRQPNGKVYCNDGWAESVADYDFMVACKNYKFNCNIAEWSILSEKYDLWGFFNQMQDITDKMSDIAHDAADLSKSYDANLFYTLQTQYNTLKKQYDLALSFAERECEALGADRDSQQNYERMQLELYNLELKNARDKLAQLEQEEQKLTEDYLTALKNLNTCPENSTLNSDSCNCNDGYISTGSACITYTQSCQAKYGVNSYGEKQYCHCSAGYSINTSQTACIKTEVKSPTPSPTEKPTVKEIIKTEEGATEIKPTIQAADKSNEVPQKITQPAEKLIMKDETAKESTLTASASEKISVPEEVKKEAKAGFFVRVFKSIKNFFWNIFK